MRRRQQPVEVSPAWLVGPGDELVGGVKVISVRRNVKTRMVVIGTTAQPAGIEVAGEHPVRITRRAH